MSRSAAAVNSCGSLPRSAKIVAPFAIWFLVACAAPTTTVAPGSSVAVSQASVSEPGASVLDVIPRPLEVGTRITRSARGESTRRFSYETKTVTQVDSTTTFSFTTETVVVALKNGVVEELSCTIRDASRITNESVLPPLGWVPLGVPLSERPLAIAGLSFNLRREGTATQILPDDARSREARAVLEELAAPLLLGRDTTELSLPASRLVRGEKVPGLIEPIRAIVTSELGWARIPQPTPLANQAESVTVRDIAPDGRSATLDFTIGGKLPAEALGAAAIAVVGTLHVGADGRPIRLSAAGDTEHAFRTMAGFDRAVGTVSLVVEWK